jgi:hypothetical protein
MPWHCIWGYCWLLLLYKKSKIKDSVGYFQVVELMLQTRCKPVRSTSIGRLLLTSTQRVHHVFSKVNISIILLPKLPWHWNLGDWSNWRCKQIVLVRTTIVGRQMLTSAQRVHHVFSKVNISIILLPKLPWHWTWGDWSNWRCMVELTL